jgi:hypothetical protein
MALTELEKTTIIQELYERIGVTAITKVSDLPHIDSSVSDDYIIVSHSGKIYRTKLSELPPNAGTYTDAQARAAMGTKDNSNPYHHDRYTDVEALAATIDDTGSTVLGWSAAKITSELAALTANGAKITDADNDTYVDVESAADIDIILAVATSTTSTDLFRFINGAATKVVSITGEGKIVGGTANFGLFYNDGATDYDIELATKAGKTMWDVDDFNVANVLYTNTISIKNTVISGSSVVTGGGNIIVDNLTADNIIELPEPTSNNDGLTFGLDIKDVGHNTTVLAFSNTTFNISRVEALGGSQFKYYLSGSPDLSSVLSTDYIKTSLCGNPSNNGTFAIDIPNDVAKTITITNLSGVDENPCASGKLQVSVLRLPNPLSTFTLNDYYLLKAYSTYNNYRTIKLD